MSEWAVLLRKARTDIGMSRPALAAGAGVSAQTVKAYELGLRRPSQTLLSALLDVLELDRRLRNEILVGAGFAPDGGQLGPHNPDYMYTVEEARSLIEGHPWPACVASEMMEVVAANRAAQRLWGVDLDHEFASPVERNLATFATNPRFADHVKNWEAVTSVAIGVLKGHHRGAVPLPESATAYFAAVMERVFDGNPRYVRRLLDLWDRVPARTPKIRWFFETVWSDNVAGEMRFKVSVAMADEPGGLTFHDWIPADAETWSRLDTLVRGCGTRAVSGGGAGQ
ncbi:MAG: helix-turn-helix transcriptional regulator [Dehalococcoidia bacterium]|nr:helix-turn-helix transcriptional regulator [Dehalococcoidia bacterium]